MPICRNIVLSVESGPGGTWPGLGTFVDPLSGGGERLGEPAIDPTDNCDPVDDSGVGGCHPANDCIDSGISGEYGGARSICGHIALSVESGLAGGASGTFVGSSRARRFCDAAFTSLVTSPSRRTSGFSRTATGAARAKLMMESIRRARVSIWHCCIFVGCVRDT
jgi:hypothetical protein